MAKIFGLQGAMTGKLGNSVMAIRNGEQIVRQYQPVVANPSTELQVAARAKMKLMSQLSAVMGPFIAIPRVKTASPRNRFVSINYPLVTYSNNAADINLGSVKITKSVLGIPSIIVARGEDNKINPRLNGDLAGVSRVVFVAFEKNASNELRYLGSAVSTDVDPDAGVYKAVLPVSTAEVVVYAYGVRDNSETARVVFGNMQSPTAEQIAKLVVSRTLLETDVTLTDTAYGYIPAVGE